MERCARPQPRRSRDRPSFSSSLLDAIYRSIDEPDDATSRTPHSRGAPDRLSPPAPLTTKPNGLPGKITAPVIEKPQPRRHSFVSTPTSSESSNSVFSSSDAETFLPDKITAPVNRRRAFVSSSSSSSDVESVAHSVRLQVRDPPPPPPPERKSIRSRLRELRKSKAPASPGARLASFLNSLFASAASPKKGKLRVSAPEEPGMRSCLSKTPSSAGRSAGKRSVRFWPVGVLVGEDCRPCGSRWIYGGDRAARVAEMMRGFHEEDDDGDDVASDASSDLFELENLTVRRGGFSDELPVYETTHMGTNLAIVSGLV
ncbi:hypothetical protein J5N97_009445 [Dioscorea zingiberensis]|uniref:Uncharacterized protein n=1 Tax=Dioscorea zingiberensis TaxID=325984 RepID=A0A9D5CZH1_9LILI|nr:hypothetical protein J5N97_009445 [Dioscorea zingiberensis]